jgi:hypothetical protein
VNPAEKGLQHLKPAARVDPHVEGDLGSTGGMLDAAMLDAATQTPSLPQSANHVLLSFPGGMLRPSNVRSHGQKGEKNGQKQYVVCEKERTEKGRKCVGGLTEDGKKEKSDTPKRREADQPASLF